MIAVPPSPSGLPAVDRQWGGLAHGRAYLLVGRAGAGRSALALQTARAAIDAGERCLVISPRAPEDLVEIGRGIGLDLAAAHSDGLLRLLRIPSAADLAARGPEGLAKSYRDLASLVTSDKPGRVIIEDFTPLVQFDTFERFHDAFSALVGELRDQGTTMLIGLGDPANDASRRLLDVVEKLVDGTIRLGSGGDLVLATPGRTDYPSSDGSSREAVPPPAPEAVAPEPVAPPEPVVPEPESAAPTPEPVDSPPLSPPEPVASPSEAEAVPPQAEVAPPVADAPSPSDLSLGATAPQSNPAPPSAPGAASSPSATSSFQARLSDPSEPAPPSATSAENAPEADGLTARLASAMEAPPALVPEIDLEFGDEAPGASGPGGLVETDIIAPPPADPSLMHAGSDPFGYDPADALFQQGFLADSGIGQPAMASTSPFPQAASPASVTPPAMPSFAPLGAGAAPAADPNAAFHGALGACFAARAAGTPFQVIALRMDSAAPAAAHFGAVEAGLRSALRPSDHVLVDAARTRAAVVLPSSGPDAGQALFGGLQAHLRAHLGPEAEGVLQSVSAVTISDGQPFQTAAELVAYAIEG